MTEKDILLAQQILKKYKYKGVNKPETITLDSGDVISFYIKHGNGNYVCSITKVPDATTLKDYYTICTDCNEKKIVIVSPEAKQSWFEGKLSNDYIGELYGRDHDKESQDATFAKLGIRPDTITTVLKYEKPIRKINLWEGLI